MKIESLDPLAHPGSIDTAPPAIGQLTPTFHEVGDAWAHGFSHPSSLGKTENMISGANPDHFSSKPEIFLATGTLSDSQQTAKPTLNTLQASGNQYVHSLLKSNSSNTLRKTQTPFRAPASIPVSLHLAYLNPGLRDQHAAFGAGTQ